MRSISSFVIFLILPHSTFAALPPLPEELPGALVIYGGGDLPDSIRDKFFELAGKGKAKIVVISTVTNDAAAAEKILAPWQKLKPLTVELLMIKAAANDPQVVKPLTEATAVWFGDGDPARLTAKLQGTLVEKELLKLFQSGKVIGGCVPRLGWLPGFVLDEVGHTDSKSLMEQVEMNPGCVGLGIREETAVIIRGRRLQVLGKNQATICLSAGKNKRAEKLVLKAGEVADLFSLRRGALARASEQFPAAKPNDPVVPHGALVIGGGGALPDSVCKRFIELAGGPESLIIYVATAQEDPIPADPGECKMLRRLGAKNVKTLHTRDRKEANDPAYLKDLKEAKGVWFSGGRQWRFVDSYEGTEAEKLFRDVLARGGVIGGSSAGASIQSEYMPRGHPLGNLVMMAEGYERGFGYLPGAAVDQHFFARKRTADMTKLIGTYPQLLGIGIDEGTALIVQGSVMEVVGKSKAAVYDRRKPIKDGAKDYEELPAGSKYDLKKRERIDN